MTIVRKRWLIWRHKRQVSLLLFCILLTANALCGGYVDRIFPKRVELQALMSYYDVDGDGNISYDEFVRGLRDELTPRRKAMVDKAFAMMDRD